MIRGFLKSIVGIALFFGLVLGILISTIYLKLTNPNYYKNAFNESNFYADAPEFIAGQLNTSITDQLRSELQKQIGKVDVSILEAKLSPVIENAVGRIITPELLKTTFENNIGLASTYFNNKQTKDLMFFIPKDALITQVKNETPAIIKDVKSTISSFPTCTAAQTVKLMNTASKSTKVINCLPATLKNDLLNDKNFDVLNHIDDAVAELQKKTPLLTGKNEITLKELIDSTTEKGKKRDYEAIQTSQDLKDAHQLIKSGFDTFWFSIFVLLVIYTLLSKGNLAHKIRNTSFLTLFVGIILFIPSMIVKYYLTPILLTRAQVDAIAHEGVDQKLAESAIRLVRELITGLNDPLFLTAAGIIFISVLLIIGMHVIGNEEKNELKVKEPEKKLEQKPETQAETPVEK